MSQAAEIAGLLTVGVKRNFDKVALSRRIANFLLHKSVQQIHLHLPMCEICLVIVELMENNGVERNRL